jgi:chaperonin cofactor prefoldin
MDDYDRAELLNLCDDLRNSNRILEEQIYTYEDKIDSLENEVEMLKEQLRINSKESYYDRSS